ncbi:hypothetical protein HQQ94_14090 [Shewanella sp. VB17]|uniref:acyl-homoserine-lactone synthase n=1 Tax=Shewanella sp. VB17 TaxID=2739432 RepID=UPI001564F852|nr:acyl-homoserine-lactone synthase [Shewanella sp. VB17]NRD74341.1 hypothetical protein [Shewanella sp. VB17]
MTIECVSVLNSHLFDDNLLTGQHQLRYKALIMRQNWQLKTMGDLEFDQYDNPATVYFVYRKGKQVCGVARLYPTVYPYMLEDIFPNLVTKESLPKSASTWEGSRLCVDKDLTPSERQTVCQELVLGYLEYGLAHGINSIVGVMLPVYWKSVFINNGCQLAWLGEVMKDDEGKKIRAARLVINHDTLSAVRERTGISEPVLSYGKISDTK